MSNQTQVTNGGIDFAGLLTIVFITLKLCGVITWSWWWVLSPIWITMLVVIAILVTIVIAFVIRAAVKRP